MEFKRDSIICEDSQVTSQRFVSLFSIYELNSALRSHVQPVCHLVLLDW